MISSKKLTLYSFLLIVAAYLVLSNLTHIPGYVLNDEAIYFLMVRNFAETGGFELWNGYWEFPSPELVPTFTSVHQQRLISQYPYLYPLLCLPFYWIGGYSGMLWVNILAFPGIVALCYAIAMRLFHDRRLAFRACGILVLATFTYEYSQAAMTHVITTLFITAAFLLGAQASLPAHCGIEDSSATTALYSYLPALASGLIIGLAMGIRLDAVFMLPALMLPLLFRRPWHPKPALTIGLGALPGIMLLSVTNFIKFGTFSFLSYGYGGSMLRRHLPFAGLSALGLIGLWMLTRRPVTARLRRYSRQILIMLIVSVAVLALIPQVRAAAGKRLNMICQLVVDFRIRSTLHIEESLDMSPRRGMWFSDMDGLKKSLLQSCPYLVVLLLPFLRILRGKPTPGPSQEGNASPSGKILNSTPLSAPPQGGNMALVLLFSAPIVFIGFYGYRAWHGGHSLNLRYLVPIFPFTSILTAHAWHELTSGLQAIWRWIAVILGIVIVALYVFLLRPAFTTFEQQEFLYLTLPLLLALFLGLLLVATLAKRYRQRQKENTLCVPVSLWQIFAVTILLISLFWAGLVEFFYDYPRARHVRQRTLAVATQTAELVADNAILFSTKPFPFWQLIERNRLRVANPAVDGFQSFPALLTFHLNQGHAVYGTFTPEEWNVLKKHDFLDPVRYKVVPLGYFSGILCQITEKSDSSSDL